METFSYKWRGLVYQVAFLSLAGGVLYIGAWLTSINWLGHEWFSRSGSVVVVIGVISGFGSLFVEQVLRSRLVVQERIALLKARRKFRQINAPDDFTEAEIARIEQHFDELEIKLQNTLKIRAGALEFFMLIVGTLVWGFGDILIAHWF